MNLKWKTSSNSVHSNSYLVQLHNILEVKKTKMDNPMDVDKLSFKMDLFISDNSKMEKFSRKDTIFCLMDHIIKAKSKIVKQMVKDSLLRINSHIKGTLKIVFLMEREAWELVIDINFKVYSLKERRKKENCYGTKMIIIKKRRHFKDYLIKISNLQVQEVFKMNVENI